MKLIHNKTVFLNVSIANTGEERALRSLILRNTLLIRGLIPFVQMNYETCLDFQCLSLCLPKAWPNHTRS